MNSVRSLCRILLASAGLLLAAMPLLAADLAPRPAKVGKVNKAIVAEAVTDEQKAKSLGFARAQHPELAELLTRLEQTDPREFTRAIQELLRTQERLDRFAERDPARFSLELELWKVDSRMRLVMAQMVMGGDAELEEQLKPMLAERRDLKRKLLEYERSRTVDHLADVDRQLSELNADPENYKRQELLRLKKNMGKQKKPGKVGAGEGKGKAKAKAFQKKLKDAKGKDGDAKGKS